MPLTPDSKKENLIVDLHGDLAGILKISTRGKYNATEQKMLYNQITELAENIEEDENPDIKGKLVAGGRTNLSGDILKMVAGERYHFKRIYYAHDIIKNKKQKELKRLTA